VTSIGWYAFRDCTSLEIFNIPNSVTSIGYGAFWGCSSLTSITIPDSVTSIGEGAFSGSFLTSITIPYGVTSIGDQAFANCYSLHTIIIPDTVTSIGSGAFASCTSLEIFNIPSSVTSIEEAIFSNCTSLSGIAIPESVTSIGETAFWGCSDLVYITIGDSVTSIGESAFEGTNFSYNYTADNVYYLISRSGQNAYLIDGANASGSVNIPTQVNTAYVKLISGDAFSDATSLTSITIPEGVTSIGDYAFESCESLVSITIPDSVTSIGESAFSYCTSLISITIPDSITAIRRETFRECSNLISITIPDNVTSIGYEAFDNCTALTSVSLSSNLAEIGYYAFDNCTSLNNITIPDSVTSILDGSFRDCESLTSITIPDSVTSIGASAFRNCTNLTNISIPDSVTSIGNTAFDNCTSLTNITLPYRFVGSTGFFGISADTEITADFNEVSEGLLANTNFLDSISEDVTFDSSTISQAIADEAQARADADAILQANIDAVAVSMQSYVDSAVAQARADGVTAGIQSVTSDPQSYQLYSESSIMEMNVTNPTLSMLNESEQAQVEFTLETSTDLEDWSIEERILRTVQATGDKFFVRIKSGIPYVTPTVLVFNHPSYGEILTDQSGNVLYGFSIDSAGGDPIYSGAAWPLTPQIADPEPDAGVTAALTSGTFSNASGGPWLKINNRPVYTYASDSEANQASGHGLGSVWFTIKPDGTLNQ